MEEEKRQKKKHTKLREKLHMILVQLHWTRNILYLCVILVRKITEYNFQFFFLYFKM